MMEVIPTPGEHFSGDSLLPSAGHAVNKSRERRGAWDLVQLSASYGLGLYELHHNRLTASASCVARPCQCQSWHYHHRSNATAGVPDLTYMRT